ncbi:hypothetical protein [Acrocarpospora corrugata]|uniref:hypothetical protein n=1 Tax=Acrocarpospora corrugata TaxID=35763 RepID=UPI0012D33EB0|nr:hypothetical protein [Acrocarpospora corrugata]
MIEPQRVKLAEELRGLGLPVPPVGPLPFEPAAGGSALRRLVNFGLRDPLVLILPEYRVLVDGFMGLGQYGFHPRKLGAQSIDQTISLLWGFAREPHVEFSRYDPARLQTSAGLEQQSRGFLNQRVVIHHPEVAGRLGLYSALASGPIHDLAMAGQAQRINGVGNLVKLPQGVLQPPRMGVNVETLVNGRWIEFWDVITYSRFSPGQPGPGGIYWPARVEIKVATPETRQLRNEPRRLLDAQSVRWTDADTGALVDAPPQEIFPELSPHARQLVLGRMRDGPPAVHKGDEVTVRSTRSGQSYLRYDMRLEMIWIDAIIKMIMR